MEQTLLGAATHGIPAMSHEDSGNKLHAILGKVFREAMLVYKQ